MLTDNLLLENGYKEYPDTLYKADCLFQKIIKNNNGQTKYFIDIYKYTIRDKANYEVRLVTETEKYFLNILLYGIDNNMSLEEIESKIYEIWYSLNCKYYDCGVE